MKVGNYPLESHVTALLIPVIPKTHRVQGIRNFYHVKIQIDKVDPNKRYQVGLTIKDLFPKPKSVCACGCGRKSRRRFKELECMEICYTFYYIIKGDLGFIDHELEKRDGRKCARCGGNHKLEKDHIVPVFAGGGGCTLDNWQWLCDDPCHIIKTNVDNELWKSH